MDERSLAANNGAVAAHVSENEGSSYGDRYARNLAVTRGVIPAVSADSPADELDRAWHVAAFSFDSRRHVLTAYLDGRAGEYWIERPQEHPFYQWVARGWEQGQYRPPESKPPTAG